MRQKLPHLREGLGISPEGKVKGKKDPRVIESSLIVLVTFGSQCEILRQERRGAALRVLRAAAPEAEEVIKIIDLNLKTEALYCKY